MLPESPPLSGCRPRSPLLALSWATGGFLRQVSQTREGNHFHNPKEPTPTACRDCKSSSAHPSLLAELLVMSI